MRRRLPYLAGTALVVGLGTYALGLRLLPLSHEGLSAQDPRLALIVPKPLRQLVPPGLCAELRYDKAPIECGGLCGTVYRLHFGSTLSQEALEAALDLPALTRTLGAQEITLGEEMGGACRKLRLDVFFDERPK